MKFQTKKLNSGLAKIWIIAIIIILAVVIGGGIYWWNKISTPIGELETKLELDIRMPESIKVGEVLKGEYLMKYNGEPFKGIVLYSYSREGFEDKTAYGKTAGLIKTGDFDSFPSALRMGLIAFRMDETGFIAGGDSFEDPGEYTFTMSVFKCSDIGLDEEECSARTPEEFILNFEPLNSVSKTITVVGESVSKEATTPTEKTVLDCDVKDPKYGECTSKFLNLFEENLRLCKPSKGTTPIGWEPAVGIIRGYEILGVQNNLCVINFWFLDTRDIFPEMENIPDTLLNKQMTCKYSTSERTIEKVAATDNCTGPLYDEINRFFGEE